MLNSICVQARLGQQPELKKTPSGVSTCSVQIACDRSYVRAGSERVTDWFTLTAWRSTAEFLAKHFNKGDMIIVSGSLQSKQFTDKEGKRRTSYEIVPDVINFGQAKATSKPNNNDGFEEIQDTEDMPF